MASPTVLLYKSCPCCRKTLAASALECPQCGHNYSTARPAVALVVWLWVALAFLIFGFLPGIIGSIICGVIAFIRQREEDRKD